MSVVFEVNSGRPDESAEAIEAASRAINDGGLVVFPTDTVYGIACLPNDAHATGRLFESKRRPSGLNLPVLAHSAQEALDLAAPGDAARMLAETFWPGPLTLVLARGARSKGWRLGDATGTIALRVPDHVLPLALLGVTGPLAATSANISGRQPLRDRASLLHAFGEAVGVYIVAPAGARTPSGRSSTVVDLTGPKLRVLREGPIDAATISSAIGGRRGREDVPGMQG
jgi:tRNA threonylcarbamoyl adenosine modification protein (Sua5/YciO/YrdC/YwlC family)